MTFIVREVVIKTIFKKKKCKRQNGCLKRPYKLQKRRKANRQRRKGKICPLECRVLKSYRSDKEFLREQWK